MTITGYGARYEYEYVLVPELANVLVRIRVLSNGTAYVLVLYDGRYEYVRVRTSTARTDSLFCIANRRTREVPYCITTL